tara:strand:+ start:79 stop:357 length:279 start_codon:yes stop_codon:yes gene_type:complete
MKYTVQIRIPVYITLEVEADNKAEADKIAESTMLTQCSILNPPHDLVRLPSALIQFECLGAKKASLVKEVSTSTTSIMYGHGYGNQVGVSHD